MAWRNFRLAFLHALREAGASAISTANAVATTQPVERLFDGRHGVNFAFDSSESDHDIVVDRGASPEAIDRMVIPAGHNLDGATLVLEGDTTSGFSTPTSLVSEAVAEGLIDIDFSSNSEQYVRLSFTGTGQWELPELWLTRTRTMAAGPEPIWGDELRHNALYFSKAGGEDAAVELSASRRAFSFDLRSLPAADDSLIQELIAAVGVSRPFLLDPPFDDEPVRKMRIDFDVRATFDNPIPASNNLKARRYPLTVVDHLS